MELLERLGIYARAPDSRPVAEIRADIDEELAFHLAESARALAADGLDEREAQAEARRRFGDVARIRRDCARTQLGERIMLQRIQLVLTSVLIAAVGALLWSNHAARADYQAERETTAALATELARLGEQLEAGFSRSPGNAAADAAALADLQAQRQQELLAQQVQAAQQARDAQALQRAQNEQGDYPSADGRMLNYQLAASSWAEEFNSQRDSWRHGLRVGERLAQLPGTLGTELLAGTWDRLSRDHQKQVMNAFAAGKGHPHAVEVLALSIGNSHVIKHATRELARAYSWKPLNSESECEEWLNEHREQSARQVLEASITSWAHALVDACKGSQPSNELYPLLECTDDVRIELVEGAGIDLAGLLEQTGVCQLEALRFGAIDPDLNRRIERVLSWCKR